MINHIVEDAIKRIANGFTEEENLTLICPSIFEEVCKKNNWIFELDDYGYNGWEVDWWADIIINEQVISVYGTMYYGTAKLTLHG